MGDWQPGDLALCVKQGPWKLIKSGKVGSITPQCGQIYQVRVVSCYPQGHFLGFTEGRGLFVSNRFIKITPGHQIEGSEVDQRNPWKVGQDA